MLKVFQVKRGATFSFIITFKNLNQDVSSMDFGVKADYGRPMLIEKELGDGITKISTGKYKVDFSTSDITNLSAGLYVFDLRYTVGSTPSIPLSGYLVVSDSVFTNNQGE
jgi:hypothetical protein